MDRRGEIYTDYVRIHGDPSLTPQLAFVDVAPPSDEAIEGVLKASEGSRLVVLNWMQGARSAAFALMSDVEVFRLSRNDPWCTKSQKDVYLRPLDPGGRVCIASSSVCLTFPEPEQNYVIYDESAEPDVVGEARYLSIYTGLNADEPPIVVEAPYLAEGQWERPGMLSRYRLSGGGGRGPFNTRAPLIAPSLQIGPSTNKRWVDIPESTSRSGLAAITQGDVQAFLQDFIDSKVAVPGQQFQLGDVGTGLKVRRGRREADSEFSDTIYVFDDDRLDGVISPTWPPAEPLLAGAAFAWPRHLPVKRQGNEHWPTAILKLTTSPPLRSLFFGSGFLSLARETNPRLWDQVRDLIGTESEPGLIPDDWSGLVVFGARADSSRPDVSALVPKSESQEPTFVLQLLALSSGVATSIGSLPVGKTSTTALRLTWVAGEVEGPGEPDPDNSSLRLTSLTATCLFDRLEELSVKVNLNIDRIFGLDPPKGGQIRTAELEGQFSRQKDQLELRAVIAGDLLSFGSETADEYRNRLFRYGQINALTASYVEEGKRLKLKVSVGGRLQIGVIEPFTGLSDKVLEFEDLVLIEPDEAGGNFERNGARSATAAGARVRALDSGLVPLKADYSKVQVATLGDIELLSTGTVKVKIDKVRYAKKIKKSDLIASEGMVPLGLPEGVRIDLFNDDELAEALWLQLSARWAPQPSWGGAIDIRVRLGAGVPLAYPTQLFFGVGASELSAPRIDLGNVASFGFDKLELGTYEVQTSPVPRYPYFLGTNFHCSLFGTKIAENVSGLIFNGPRGTGVLFTYVRPKAAQPNRSSYQVKWLLVGHNAHSAGFTPVLDNLTNLALPWADEQVSQLGGFLDVIYKDPERYLEDNSGSESGWLFGVAVSFSGLDCIVLMAEGVGGVARFHGTKLSKLLPVGQLVLYYFSATAGKPERFGISISLSEISLGFAVVTGGVIVVEWSPNGSFLIDVGFPWARPGSVRQWGRALTLWFGTVQMSGGFYLSLTKTTQEPSHQTFALGLAGQYGYGIASVIAAGPALIAMSARIGVYAIVEGKITVRSDGAIEFFEFRGVIGVLAEVRIRVAVWCISLDASVVANGEAELAVTNYPIPPDDLALIECRYAPPLVVQEIVQRNAASAIQSVQATATVRLAFDIEFSVTIDLGLFKVERKFEQKMSAEVQAQFNFEG